MNWFQRHLHWTVVFAWLAPYLVLLGTSVALWTMYDGSETSVEAALIRGLLPAFVQLATTLCALCVALWVLTRKNRSYWWMLFPLFVPFGFIAVLALENRTGYPGVF
jgi:biopolymer transport protein ExbB/TolQ